MKIGLHALGIGTGAQPGVIAAVGRAAEAAGFATLWAGEHVIMVDEPASRYPYASDGQIAVPAAADWLDPLLALTYAAAVTTRIGLATGILLLPEHNPLIVAKQAASIDLLSGGRFSFGAGIGWSAEEYAALGVPFARRGARLIEYLAAMRQLWCCDVASFEGEFVRFRDVRIYPKPVRDRRIPVILGGNSDSALDRVAACADGWYGFNVAADSVAGRLAALAEAARGRGRDPRSLHVAVAVPDCGPGDLSELAAAGVDEFVVVSAPPADPADVAGWIGDLGARWVTPVG
ncbi:MAG: LLM class F420-dependent oxidoreductase [Streptosporangiaceae bacterium]